MVPPKSSWKVGVKRRCYFHCISQLAGRVARRKKISPRNQRYPQLVWWKTLQNLKFLKSFRQPIRRNRFLKIYVVNSLIEISPVWKIWHMAIFEQEGVGSDQMLFLVAWFSIFQLLGVKLRDLFNDICGHSGLPKVTDLISRCPKFEYLAIFYLEGVGSDQRLFLVT